MRHLFRTGRNRKPTSADGAMQVDCDTPLVSSQTGQPQVHLYYRIGLYRILGGSGCISLWVWRYPGR